MNVWIILEMISEGAVRTRKYILCVQPVLQRHKPQFLVKQLLEDFNSFRDLSKLSNQIDF